MMVHQEYQAAYQRFLEDLKQTDGVCECCGQQVVVPLSGDAWKNWHENVYKPWRERMMIRGG